MQVGLILRGLSAAQFSRDCGCVMEQATPDPAEDGACLPGKMKRDNKADPLTYNYYA